MAKTKRKAAHGRSPSRSTSARVGASSARAGRKSSVRARASAARTHRATARPRGGAPRIRGGAVRVRRGTARARGGIARPSKRSTEARAARTDAIAVLKADHENVRNWFAQFARTRSSTRKRDLAQKISTTMLVHTKIEEEIFYPAFLKATGELAMHHQAEVEHDGARKLISHIEASDPEDEYYDARVAVLETMIAHHLNEEETADGMFAKARQSGMDLEALGRRLSGRRAELMSSLGVMVRRVTAKARGAADQAVSGIAGRLGLQ